MLVALYSRICARAQHVADGCQKLEKQCRRIGLGLGLDEPHDLACDAVEGC